MLPSARMDGQRFDLSRKAKATQYISTLESLGLQANPALHALPKHE